MTPKFDEVLEQIAEIDDRIDLIMFETHPNLKKKIKERWQIKSPKLCDKVKFMPRIHYNEFIDFIAQLDIVLDPPASGPEQSSTSAWHGVPVVTKPSQLLKTE